MTPAQIVETIERLEFGIGTGKRQIVLIRKDGTAETIRTKIFVREGAIGFLTKDKVTIVPFAEIENLLKREICDFQGCDSPAATPRLRGIQACNDHIEWWDRAIEEPN